MAQRSKVRTTGPVKTTVSLPDIWKKAAGILKGKKRVSAVRYQRKLRAQWK